MTEERATEQEQTPSEAPKAAPAPEKPKGDARTFRIRQRPERGGKGRFGGRGRRDPKAEIPEQSDYEEKSLEIARITRVTAGGKRMRFRALGIVGNRKGRVGFGVGKGTDVAGATSKAFAKARKSLITIPLVNETIPHDITSKFCSAVILMKPAPKGTGVKAGGAVRQVLELAGVPNISAKIMGSANKVNNVKATFKALGALRMPPKSEKTDAEKPKSEKTESKQKAE